ncbi:LysR family transcriptional regulator [Roseibium hamelinense]|uniref:LysR family transcriptional regulator n=1 Tax=Roseibium hamelinense TaxID=150831 RepID=A0A562T1L0_9HYPH|nr:LysR family transcriptional regulator [Roseibium hamelinense]MTI44474.1 LysR family transcriptional regulator [Roseibium hamelinense]TWI87442.1 LysR family transcriptional regulator [Roseibium hamelinense]
MNWGAISFDWNQARAFLATAEEGSLSAAARALGLTQPTLGRQISALEQQLGVVLFERSGRGLAVTPTGQGLLEHVKAMATAANGLSLAASGQSKTIEGKVCISASDVAAAYMLPEVLAELRDIAPGIEIDIVATNSVSDLRQREADIALRHVRPEQPDLIARLVRNMTARLYAAPSYLSRHGHPASLQDLASATFVSFGDRDRLMRELGSQGIVLSRASLCYNTESGLVAWQLVRDGLCIGIMADDVAARYSDVVPVFPDMDPIPFPLWLVTHRELHTSRKFRIVFDFLAEKFSVARSPAKV